MGFRFKKQEDFQKGFVRIAGEQIARATREWKNADRAVAVHETRKCLKRLRSLLALARPVLEQQACRAENANLRAIARSLSVSRDRQVMLDTIDQLMPDATREDAGWLKRLRRSASREITDAPAGTTPNEKKTAKAIAEAGKRLAALEPQASGFDVAAAGFERTYRQGRERMSELSAGYSVEASHDWRKRVQAHWRQLSLLAPAWPAYFQTRIALALRCAGPRTRSGGPRGLRSRPGEGRTGRSWRWYDLPANREASGGAPPADSLRWQDTVRRSAESVDQAGSPLLGDCRRVANVGCLDAPAGANRSPGRRGAGAVRHPPSQRRGVPG